MNPPPRLFPNPFVKPRGCAGDGCASDPDTWPLHDTLRGGVHCLLCCSCVLLSHRPLYCCRCFFLVTSPSSNYDDGDTLMAPPAPTVTCQVCREAVAHLPCLYYDPADAINGVFVCPPCTAAQNGRPFTYAPPCGQPIDERGARVLVLAARIALALLQRQAAAVRATAERMAREAIDARKIADEALNVAYDLAKKENLSWVLQQSEEGGSEAGAASEEGGCSEARANLLVRQNEMPSLATLTIGTGGSVVPMALTDAKHAPSSSQSIFDLFNLKENAAEDEAEAVPVQAEPRAHLELNSFNVKEVAMAAAEAARASPSTPQMLHLFPGAKASSSTKMPRTKKKPRTKRPVTLQLFKRDDDQKNM